MPTAGGVTRLALAATLLAGAVIACQGSDPYYRNRGDGGGGTLHPSNVGGMAGTAGAAGAAGTTGAGGSSAPCSTCMVRVQYTCRSNDTGQASFVFDVTNESSASISLSSLTLRYWYTADAGKEQTLDCVAAQLGCTNLITSADAIPGPGPRFVPVMPPRPLAMPTANLYAEIAFKAGALSLAPLLDTGEIQMRLHNHDFSTIDQDDDYSYDAPDCTAMNGTALDWSHLTAYLDGVLVWGLEPPLVLPPP